MYCIVLRTTEREQLCTLPSWPLFCQQNLLLEVILKQQEDKKEDHNHPSEGGNGGNIFNIVLDKFPIAR